MPCSKTSDEWSLVDITVARIRRMMIDGQCRAGQKLHETKVATQLSISRNTLREAFRVLESQGLVTHIPNRGVYVTAADEARVIDIFRMRTMIQCRALHLAHKTHPGVRVMRDAAKAGEHAALLSDWKAAVQHNIEYHRAMVTLCDSSRISGVFELTLTELSLVLSQLDDIANIHAPFLPLNFQIVSLIVTQENSGAVALLESYLLNSERTILGALQRTKKETRFGLSEQSRVATTP